MGNSKVVEQFLEWYSKTFAPLLFKLVKWTRTIRIFFGGYKAMEEKHKLFLRPKPLTPEQIYSLLIPHCYQYNHISTTYKKQIFTVRKLTSTEYQIHLRFYSDGWVSGHYELQPEQYPLGHLWGVDLRQLNKGEILVIREQLGL